MDYINRNDAIIQLSHNKNGNDDCDIVVQRDIETIKMLKSPWIACDKKKLPDFGEVVLVTYKNGITMAKWCEDGCWRQTSTQNGYVSPKEIRTVTAWMPLPYKYEGE